MIFAPAYLVLPVDCSGVAQQLFVLAFQSPRLPLVAPRCQGLFLR